MKLFLPAFLIILAVYSTSCVQKVQPSPPGAEPITKKYEHKLSSINLPIQVSVQELEKTVNEEFKGIIYEDNSYTNNDNDDLKIKVTKIKNINVQIKDNTVYYVVPINIWAKIRKVILGQELAKSTQFDAVLKFKTAIDIDNKWNLKTTTSVEKYVLASKPVLSFGPLKVPIGPIIEAVLDSYLPDVAETLDEEISNELDTREYMKETYAMIQKPMLVSEEYNTWLTLKPKNFYMTPLKTTDHELKFDIGMNTYIDLAVSKEKPAEMPVDKVLPNLTMVNKMEDNFEVAVASEITFDQATKLMKENLVGYVYEHSKKQKIEITDAEAFGAGDKIGIKIAFEGKKMEGIAYLKGIPKYDTATAELSVDDFEFDLESKKALLKAAEWLAKGPFKKVVQKNMRFSMKEYIDEGVAMIKESLEDNPIDENVTLDCEINDIFPGEIYMTENSIKTMLMVTGQAKIQYGSLTK